MAIDPGLVTGVAFYTPGPEEWSLRFSSAEVTGGDLGFSAFFRDVLGSYTVGDIVCESFTITPQSASKTRQYDALYIIGWLRSEAERLGLPLSMHHPSKGKQFGTDSKLKHLGWFDRTPGGHRNDAARHLVTRLAQLQEPELMKRLGEML